MNFEFKQSEQNGQTLIETMVAVFVLVMGITAALGLANYSLNTTTGIRKQIIAMGLAREGIEAVKNMRDTNWLQLPLSTTCHNFASGASNSFCYENWLNPSLSGRQGYSLANSRPYRLTYNTSQSGIGYWGFVLEGRNRYGLDFDNTSNPQYGIYYTRADQTPKTHTEATSDYARAISLSLDSSFAPFNETTTGPRLKVTSQVWWKDKDCPASDAPPTSNKCSITLETYLTNWKNY